MPFQTLLEMTQDILLGMDSDGVSSISDTVEATQVAKRIQRVYYDLISEAGLPFKEDLINLEMSGDVDKPTHMRIPEQVQQIRWIKYDTRLGSGDAKNYEPMSYLSPNEFVAYTSSRNSTDTVSNKVVQYNANTPLVISRIVHPNYWTSFDDEYIVFDSFLESLESTLQTSKTICHGEVSPTFALTDDSVPDLPENLFPLLYAQAEANCHAFMRQTLSPKAEQSSNRLRVRLQRNKWRQARMTTEGPHYGRR